MRHILPSLASPPMPPRASRRVFVALLTGAAAAAFIAPRTGLLAQSDAPPAVPAADSRPTVAVLYFTNGAFVRAADYAPLSKGMAEMLITSLAQNPGVRVVERDRLQAVLEEQNLSTNGRVDQETAVRVGKVLGAHHLLLGAFVIDGRDNLRIDVRSVNAETSQVEYVQTVSGKADRLFEVVDQLGAKLNTGLKLPAMPMRVRTVGVAPAPAPKGPEQFRAVMLMSRALERQDRGDRAAAIALYKNALEAYPGFERARVRLAMLEAAPAGASPARSTSGSGL